VNRVLVNPAAGRGRSRRALAGLEQLATEAGIELRVSADAEDLVRQARAAVADRVERLVVAGGDGTFHHVAQALVGRACALGVVPLGRGNDFAADLAIPEDPAAAFEWALRGPVRRIDVGRVDGRYFTGYCGVGFDSEAARHAHEAPAVFRGPLAYVYAVLRTLLTFKAPTLEVSHDGGIFQGPAMFAVACNVSRFGGGMRIAPTARFDDGALDLVIARELGKIDLLRVFPKVYSGDHVDHPAVLMSRTTAASIQVDRPLNVACDGESVGRLDGGRLEVSIEPAALRVVAAGSD
jgi:YegS/Rv2252/BmrU family lipid kinase